MPLPWGAGVTTIRFEHDEADRFYRRIELLLSDLRPFWPLVVPIVTGWWRMQFETEGGFAGRPWASLSPGYAAWKSYHFGGRKILYGPDHIIGDRRLSALREHPDYKGGALKRAAASPTVVRTPHTLTMVINDPKIEFHQEGTPTMPARPLVFGDPLPAAAVAEIDAAADRYVGDFLRRF